jgi:hypothetical protein
MSIQGMGCCCGQDPPPETCIFLVDDFNRDDSSDLNVGYSEGIWYPLSGTWSIASNTLQISNGDARAEVVDNAGNGIVLDDLGRPNWRISVDIKGSATTCQAVVYNPASLTAFPTSLGAEFDFSGKVRIVVVTDDTVITHAECDYDLIPGTFYNVSVCWSSEAVGFNDVRSANFISVAIDGETVLRGFTTAFDEPGFGLGTGDDHVGTITFDNLEISHPIEDAVEPGHCSECGECCWPYTGDPQEPPEELVVTVHQMAGFSFCPSDTCNFLEGSSYTLTKTDKKFVEVHDGSTCTVSSLDQAYFCLIYEAEIPPFFCDESFQLPFNRAVLMIGNTSPGVFLSGATQGTCYMRFGFYTTEEACEAADANEPKAVHIYRSPSFGEWGKTISADYEVDMAVFCSMPIDLNNGESDPCTGNSFVRISLP